MIKKLSSVLLLLSLVCLVSCGTILFYSEEVYEEAVPAYFTVETSLSVFSDSPVRKDKAVMVDFNIIDFEIKRAFELRIRENLSKAGMTVYISSDYEEDYSQALSKAGFQLQISVNTAIVFEIGGLSVTDLKCTLYGLGGDEAQRILYMYVAGNAAENRFYSTAETWTIAARELSDALCATLLENVE